MFRVCWIVAGAALLPSSAHAQFTVTVLPSIIGNAIGQMGAASAEGQCLQGTPMPPSEVGEARAPSSVTLRQYFAAAQSGGSKLAAFQADSKTRFFVADIQAPAAAIEATADPLARSGDVLVDEPIRFFRSGMDGTALGQWIVREAGGGTAGVYTALIVRKSGAWKLRTLTASVAGEKVGPAMQFCHVPGDVVKFNVDTSRLVRESAEKRLAKSQARAARALVESRRAEERALEAERAVARRTVDAREAATLASAD